MLATRGQKLLKTPSAIVKGHITCMTDPYHPENNPEGYINLGTAENKLMDDVLVEKINSLELIEDKHLHYFPPPGPEDIRRSLAHFFEKFLNIKSMDERHITLGSGASATLEMLTYCLLDPGEKVLIPTPYYPGFEYDMAGRFNTTIEPSHCLKDGVIDFSTLEKDIQKESIKALLITNPHNPTGKVLKKSEIESIIEIAKKYSVEIITDEIYALSIYGDEIEFTSFLDEKFDHLNYKEHIHLIYGMAKDFGLSGFKVGFFATFNEKLSMAMQTIAYFHTVSNPTHNIIKQILDDHQWINDFSKTNQEKIKNSYQKVNELFLAPFSLKDSNPKAGFFTFIDFSKHLNKQSSTGELQFLDHLLREAKINLTPGQAFGIESYGHFRMCFALTPEVLELAAQRIAKIM